MHVAPVVDLIQNPGKIDDNLERASSMNSVLTQLSSTFQRAFAFHQQGLFDDAQSLYDEILKVQPNNFDALHLSGVIAAQTGNPRGAVQWIDKALEVDSRNAGAHFNRGSALQQLAELPAALCSYELAVAIDPEFAEAYSNRGVVLKDLKRFAEALRS